MIAALLGTFMSGNWLTKALGALALVTLTLLAFAHFENTALEKKVAVLETGKARAQASAALCAAQVAQLNALSEKQAAKVASATAAANKVARVKPLPAAPVAGQGVEQARAWAIEQAKGLAAAWEQGQ